MKQIVLLVALLLGGCGADWFPEAQSAPGSSTALANISSSDVGTSVTSIRMGPRDYTVTTTKGVFSTYTSLGVPVRSAVALETYTDQVTGLLIGRMLRAAGQTILIKSIIALLG